MLKTVNSLRALLFATFLLFVGNSFLLSSNAIVLKEIGYDDFYIGLVGSSIYLGALFSTIFSYIVIQKVGHIRSFGFFTSLFAIATLLHVYTKEIYIWCILRFCIGYCYYALLIIIESWINQRTKNEIRSRILAIYEIVFYSGFSVGVLLLWFKLKYDYIFITAILIILFCSIPLNLLKIRQPKLGKPEKIKIPDVFNVSKLAFFTAFIGGFLMNGYYSMSQTYFIALGYKVEDISILIFTTMLGGFIAQLFVGRLSDIYGRKLAILTCSLLAFLASLGMLFMAATKFIYILCFLLGMGLFCLYALALARANDRVKESSQVLEVGRTLLFAYSLSSVLAPSIMGYLISNYGANSYIMLYVILLGVLVLFTLTQPRIEASKRVEFQKENNFISNNNYEQ